MKDFIIMQAIATVMFLLRDPSKPWTPKAIAAIKTLRDACIAIVGNN